MLIQLPLDTRGAVFRSPMPFGPFDHQGVWEEYLSRDLDLVVMLVEPQEYAVYAGRDLPAFYREHGMDVIHLPVPDFGVPEEVEPWDRAVEQVYRGAKSGLNAAVHCLAGLGRTGTFLACLAVRAKGMKPQEAVQWVRDYVPGSVQNPLQEGFVSGYQERS